MRGRRRLRAGEFSSPPVVAAPNFCQSNEAGRRAGRPGSAFCSDLSWPFNCRNENGTLHLRRDEKRLDKQDRAEKKQRRRQ